MKRCDAEKRIPGHITMFDDATVEKADAMERLAPI